MKRNLHFRKTPDYIIQEVKRANSKFVSVSAIIATTKKDIKDGKFKKFGITLDDNKVACQPTITPQNLIGLFARRNMYGYDIVHKDLPKVLRSYSWTVPNFGDPSKGYHDIDIDKWVYQRTHIPSREWEIALTIDDKEDGNVVVVAQINPPLDKEHALFDQDLFFAINLLQEQFGDCHALDSNLSSEELARITTVGWEIFPPGSIEQIIKTTITKRMTKPSQEKLNEIENRMRVFDDLHPKELIVGQAMNSKYIGAKYDENIFVFENFEYGNALYILFDNWQEISKMSRIDILRKHQNDYIRILHKKGWKKSLIKTIDELTKKK